MDATHLLGARGPAGTRRSGGRAAAWLLLLLGAVTACDDGGSEASGGFDVAAEADRLTGNAPLRVQFTAEHRAPIDETVTFAWDFGDGQTSDEAEPVHTFATPGPYTVRVEVTASGGDSGIDELAIDVAAAADLEIRDVSATPRRTRAGGPVTVAWGVSNGGAAVQGAWDQLVFLTADPLDDTAPVVPVARLSRRDDAAGAEDAQQLDVTLPADLASGDWYVGVEADPDAVVGDRDRENNVALTSAPLQVRNPTEEGPDLTPCGIDIPAFAALPPDSPAVVQLGDQLAVRVCVTNIGNRPVARFAYTVYVSRDATFDEADAAVGGREGIALGPGDRETFDELIDLAPELGAGEHHLLVVVDPADDVEERLEDNNERDWPEAFQLAEPGDVEGVDLVISRFDLDFDGDRLFWGQSAEAQIVVTNRGDTPVERFFVVQVLAEPLDGSGPVQLASGNVQGIPADAETPVNVSVRISRRVDLGRYRLVAVVDPTNGVGDVNPGNNRRVLQEVLELGGEPNVDPAIRQVTFETDQIQAGEELDVRAIVTNLGTDPTGSLEVVVYLSPTPTQTAESVEVDRFDLDSLEGGDMRPVDRAVTVPLTLDQQVPVWHVGVLVDAGNRLSDELDETNNLVFAPGTLTVFGAMGGCAEDGQFEDNDVPARASAIEAGRHDDLGLCDEADWFRVEVGAAELLEADIAWAAADGVLTLTLADAEGEPLQAGEAGPGTSHVFALAAAEPRTLLLRVAGAGARLAYDLEVRLTPTDPRPDLRVRAVNLVPDVVRPGGPVAVSFEAINSGGGDAGASTAVVHLVAGDDFDPGATALGEVDVPALAAGESALVRTDLAVGANVPDGRYRLFVTADSAAAIDESAEDNNRGSAVLRVDSVQACEADALEPNRSPDPANAAALPAGQHVDLTTCRDDDDWYAVELAAGEGLTVGAEFAAADGDLDVELYGPDGVSLLDVSAGLQDREEVQLARAAVAGPHHVRVFLAAGAAAVANTYRLDVSIRPADECGDDAFEPNGDRAAARLLPDGVHALTLCPGDEDWFRFNIPAGNTVSFQLAGGGAGVELALFDPSGELVEEDDRRIVHEAVASGFHTLRVRVEEAEEAIGYQLTVAGVSGVDLALAGLRLEPIEAAGGGDVRAAFNVQNLRGDGAGPVTVRFWLSADDRPSADDTVLADRRVERIEGGETLAVRQRLTLPDDAPAGDRFVVVEIDPERRIADLRPMNNRGAAAISVVESCADDDARENEGPGSATALEAGEPGLEAVICAFTEDWYALPVDAAGEVTLRLTFDAATGDLDLYVHAADGTLLGESRTEISPETVTVRLDAPGDLLIRVDGFLEAANPYQLAWELP